MARIITLASGSKGNCYLLETEKETLMLECGISFKQIQEGIKFYPEKVVGCLVTHEHQDHSKSIKKVLKNGINVYASRGTLRGAEVEEHHRSYKVKAKQQFKVGGFTILAFDTQHDSREPLGFLIHHKEIGKLLFVTDSYYCKYKFKGLDYIMTEANYDEDILKENVRQGYVKDFVARRIRRSHFEINDVIEFLNASDLSKAKAVILLHLSSDNSNDEFKDRVERKVGVQTYIAKKGLNLEV